jgi:kynurenine formamidase
VCGPMLVDGATKQKIAALNATFRKVSASPFGREDEIGMLNLIDEASRRAVVSSADAGKVFDMSVDYFIGMPSWAPGGDPNYQIWLTHTPEGTLVDDVMRVGDEENDLVSYSGDAFSMYTHCGTHVDTLNHFGYHREIWNHFKASEHLGSRHWKVAGADKHPPILARGVLFDVPAMLGIDTLPPSYGVGSEDLDSCLQRQSVELRPGDVALVRTGRMQAWPDPSAYMSDGPGLTLEGAKYLAEAGVVMVGADTVGLEQGPSADDENWQVVHSYLLAEAGVPILEVANCEELSQEQLYEFAFFGACIRLRGATGAPMRPIAMPMKR